MDAEKLIITARDLTSTFVLHLPNGFRPHVDVGTSDPFLPIDPWDILESGDFNHVSDLVYLYIFWLDK